MIDQKKTAIVISGMHRAGSSSIAGVVHMLGACLPKLLMPAKPENPRGFFESERIVIQNDKILAESGTNWSDWRSVNNAWPENPNFERYLQEALWILGEEYGLSEFIALKDPRFSRILPFWRIALEQANFRVCNLIPIRHPDETAASLLARNEIPRNVSKLMWVRHMLDAEYYSRGQPRVFVLWDDFMSDWEREATRVAARFNIIWPRLADVTRAQIAEFLTPELRHHREGQSRSANDTLRSGFAGEAYAAFKMLAKNSESRDGAAILDDIRDYFARAERIFGPVFADMNAVRCRIEFERDQARSCADDLDVKLSAAAADRDAALEEGSALTARLVRTRSRLVSAAEARTSLKTEMERNNAHAAALQRRLQLLESRLGELRNLGLVRRLAAVLTDDERYFEREFMSAGMTPEDAPVSDRTEIADPPVADLNLNALMGLNGVQFIAAAYERLLKRKPDDDGLSYYVPKLMRGAPKIQILAEIASSTEARASGATIPGLSAAIHAYRVSRLPVLGPVFRVFSGVEGNSAAERRLRALEQTLYTKMH